MNLHSSALQGIVRCQKTQRPLQAPSHEQRLIHSLPPMLRTLPSASCRGEGQPAAAAAQPEASLGARRGEPCSVVSRLEIHCICWKMLGLRWGGGGASVGTRRACMTGLPSGGGGDAVQRWRRSTEVALPPAGRAIWSHLCCLPSVNSGLTLMYRVPSPAPTPQPRPTTTPHMPPMLSPATPSGAPPKPQPAPPSELLVGDRAATRSSRQDSRRGTASAQQAAPNADPSVQPATHGRQVKLTYAEAAPRPDAHAGALAAEAAHAHGGNALPPAGAAAAAVTRVYWLRCLGLLSSVVFSKARLPGALNRPRVSKKWCRRGGGTRQAWLRAAGATYSIAQNNR